jgi:hypothetical protein
MKLHIFLFSLVLYASCTSSENIDIGDANDICFETGQDIQNDTNQPDFAEPDTAEPETAENPDAFIKDEQEEVSPPDLSIKLKPGEVRAGRITKKEELIGGGRAKGVIGDYKIYNSKVAFIIQDAGIKSGYKRYGGVPVDADIAREDQEGKSQLGELFFGWNQRIFNPEKVEVVSDGTSEERAVIKITGEDGHFPWLAAFIEAFIPVVPLNCDLFYEYSLGPDDEALRIDVTVKNKNSEVLSIDMNEIAFIMGDGCYSFFEGIGFRQKDQVGTFPNWTALGDGVSYGLVSMEGDVNILGSYSNVTFGTYPPFILDPLGEYKFTRYLAVNGNGISEIQRIFRNIAEDENSYKLKGHVKADKEAYDRRIRIHVLKETGEYYSVIIPDKDGNIDTELPSGKYKFIAKSHGFNPSEPVNVEINDTKDAFVEIEIQSSGKFTYSIAENGGKIPAKLTFMRKDSNPANIMAEKYGEERYPFGSALIIWSGTGEGNGILPYGKYSVTATRGYEYEKDEKLIDVTQAELNLDFSLKHSVDSSGYLSGDFHIHGEHSPDTNIPEIERVKTALAHNLEVLVMTEHDTIKDYTPAVQSIQSAENFVKAIAGSEITTYLYGHFNSWWLTEKPDQLNNGGIEWYDMNAPDLFKKIRNSESHDIIIQVNHPRSASIGGYFSSVGLDISQGKMSNPGLWSDNFDAIEIFNGGCSNGNEEALFDWFDFLNRGYGFSVSAGSDSHGTDIGNPTVYLKTEHDPKNFNPDELTANFKLQKVFVSCGAFVRFSIDGHDSGELVTYNGKLSIHVKIEAASYMKLTEFNIISNGKIIFSLGSKDWNSNDSIVRFDDTIELEAFSDGWYVLEVRGSGNSFPVSGDTPYAITNPVYVDFDGSGKFDPLLPKY